MQARHDTVRRQEARAYLIVWSIAQRNENITVETLNARRGILQDALMRACSAHVWTA
jgi:hypothetical protein